MTGNRDKLFNLTSYTGRDYVMVGNGEKLKITHIGDAQLPAKHNDILLHDVLLVPDIKKNLLSVSQLTSDLPCYFEFTSDGFVVKEQKTNQVMAKGNKKGGLYVLDGTEKQALFSARFRTTSEDVRHQQLGHPQAKVVSYLNNKNMIKVNAWNAKPHICSSCELSKNHKMPFSLSQSCSMEPLVKVHCDLWGPAPVRSIQHFRYFVLFVDDFSRYAWLYPLRRKSDFFQYFLLFQKMVERQFERKIKKFQSDGGGEFQKSEFLMHLSENGIVHQMSCPKTPEQNGVVERKHRHVVEHGLALLFHANVPKKYWVDAFMTSVFLINRTPSEKLKMKSPFSLLFGKEPDYSSLRVFGSRCFPCLREYAKNKFEPESLACVFLGYSEKHKGYRCLYPPTGRNFISRHVVFHEILFLPSRNLLICLLQPQMKVILQHLLIGYKLHRMILPSLLVMNRSQEPK